MTVVPKADPRRSRVMRIRRLLITGLLFMGGGFVIITMPNEVWDGFGMGYSAYRVLLTTAGGLIIYGLFIVLMLYLKGDVSVRLLDRFIVLDGAPDNSSPVALESADPRAYASAIQTESVQSGLIELSRTVDQLKSAQLDALAGSKDDLIAALRPTLLTDVAAELESRFASEAVDAARLNTIRLIFNASQHRLVNELSSLGRRSNLNLVIGTITTGAAVALLIYMVLWTHSEFESLTQLLSHYIPRVTIVLFIEIFSFFFLRLYRSTLGEIRVYQEDITALTLRQVALETAWSSSDKAARAALARELVTSSIVPKADTKENKDITVVDPDTANNLLQALLKAIVKTDKSG